MNVHILYRVGSPNYNAIVPRPGYRCRVEIKNIPLRMMKNVSIIKVINSSDSAPLNILEAIKEDMEIHEIYLCVQLSYSTSLLPHERFCKLDGIV